MKRWILPLILLILVGVFCVWWFSAEQIVKRRTGRLLEVITLDSGDGMAKRQLAGYALDSLLAPVVVVHASDIPDADREFDRDELVAAFASLCKQAKQTRCGVVAFRSIRVVGDRADVDCLVKLLVDLPAIRPVDGSFSAQFRWQRFGDGWRLAGADLKSAEHAK